ncbi:unnamed protein product [Mytilus coruscus]|uniref:Uncharacterized protein n=1 Tax=Mytilus coruscus TaxID=42192 RepID=A0A6J8C3E6_MYTCO|nr:unnamed protein product [Mytilus coruscus]
MEDFVNLHADEKVVKELMVSYMRRPFVSGRNCNVASCQTVSFDTYLEYMNHWNNCHEEFLNLHIFRICGQSWKFREGGDHSRIKHKKRQTAQDILATKKEQASQKRRQNVLDNGIKQRILGKDVNNSRYFQVELMVKDKKYTTVIRLKHHSQYTPYQAPKDLY